MPTPTYVGTGQRVSHVRGHRTESLPPKWLLPKTKVGLIPTFSKGVKEEFKNLQHLRLWKPVYDLTSSCQSKLAVWLTETQGNPWEPPAAEVNNEIWFPTALNLNELPGSLLCCKDPCWATAVLNWKLSPGCVHHTPDWVPLMEAPDWELLSPSHPCKPLQSKTGIQRLQSAFHTPAPGGLCLRSEPFHLAASRRRYPNW